MHFNCDFNWLNVLFKYSTFVYIQFWVACGHDELPQSENVVSIVAEIMAESKHWLTVVTIELAQFSFLYA